MARMARTSTLSNDVALVRALGSRRGERAARALYRTYGGELYGFAHRRLQDQGLAEEVVQDVFTQAWRHAESYDEIRGTVRTWLYAIARNAVTDAERRRGRRPPPALQEPSDRAAEDEPIERAVLRWQVELALARLTAEHRQILQMAHFEDCTLAQIAERTGLPLGTVKSRVHYAMANLKLALQELEVIR